MSTTSPMSDLNEAFYEDLIDLLNTPGLDDGTIPIHKADKEAFYTWANGVLADSSEEWEKELEAKLVAYYNKNLSSNLLEKYPPSMIDLLFQKKKAADAVTTRRILNTKVLNLEKAAEAQLKKELRLLEEAAEKEANKEIAKLKAERAEATKRYQEGVAKAIPALATGIRDAVMGFENGDPMAGSAAIMDICSTLAAVGGSMTLAGGPPGAIVGALFSVISMILKMFQKQQKSLTTQLEEMLMKMESRDRLRELQVAQMAIDSFIQTLMPPPGMTLDLVRNRWTHQEIAQKLNPIEGNTIDKIRMASVWLEEPETQQLPLWGEILAFQCQVYINYKYALTVAVTSLDVSAMPDGGTIVKEKLVSAFASNDPAQLAFLRRVRPLAQKRGIVWSIGYQNIGPKADCGPLLVRDTTTGDWTNLGKEQRVAAITKRKSDKAEDAHPYFAIFSLERSDPWRKRSPGHAFRNQLNKRLFFMEGRWPLASGGDWKTVQKVPPMYDIAATPGEKKGQAYLYYADGNQVGRYTNEGGPTLKDRIFVSSYEKGYTVDSLAVAPSPLAAEGENPDVLRGEKAAVYGAGNDVFHKRYIRACFGDACSTLPAPRDLANPNDSLEFTGITADRKRLWVFSRGVIACVTHTDARRYVVEVRRSGHLWATVRQPEWAVYKIPEEFAGTWQDYDAFSGLHDIAPGEDGALLAVFRTKKMLEPRIYFSRPAFDHKGGNLIIKSVELDQSGKPVDTLGWTLFDSKGHGRSNRIYRQPIFCWPLLDRLMTLLEPAKIAALQPGKQPNLVIPPIPIPKPVVIDKCLTN